MEPYNINTYTGKHFDLRDPTPEMVDLQDISHCLSMICRFTGHVEKFYSVAQHCLFMVAAAKRRDLSIETQMQCLLHDAPEAYVNDLSSPLRDIMRDADDGETFYEVIHDRIMDVVLEKWSVQKISVASIVKDLDREAAQLEFKYLFAHKRTGNGLAHEEPHLINSDWAGEWFYTEEAEAIRHVAGRYVKKFHEIQARREAGPGSHPVVARGETDQARPPLQGLSP